MTFPYNGEIKCEYNFNLKETIESGQTFLWNKNSGTLFDNTKNNTYYSTDFIDGNDIVFEVKKDENMVRWSSNYKNADQIIKKRLGLNHNLEKIEEHIIERDTENGIMEEVINEHNGLRIVNEPLFPTLISFICSTQMRVERIHSMINNIRNNFGTEINIGDDSYYSFPTATQLQKATTEQLKDLKLGYRASYVSKTSKSYHDQTEIVIPDDASEARELMKDFTGVGTKVADCVLLYGTERMDIVPIDTWMDKAIKEHYPDLYSDSNERMARDFEDHFGEYSGYAQAYLFHHIRTNR